MGFLENEVHLENKTDFSYGLKEHGHFPPLLQNLDHLTPHLKIILILSMKRSKDVP